MTTEIVTMTTIASPAPALTRDQFITIGITLRGPHWQRALAADIGCNERAVRYWARGERAIPGAVVRELMVQLQQKRAAVDGLLEWVGVVVGME